jgi:hypothetical protein
LSLEAVQVPVQFLDLLRTPFRVVLEHFAHQLLAARMPFSALILRSEKRARPVRRIALLTFHSDQRGYGTAISVCTSFLGGHRAS